MDVLPRETNSGSCATLKRVDARSPGRDDLSTTLVSSTSHFSHLCASSTHLATLPSLIGDGKILGPGARGWIQLWGRLPSRRLTPRDRREGAGAYSATLSAIATVRPPGARRRRVHAGSGNGETDKMSRADRSSQTLTPCCHKILKDMKLTTVWVLDRQKIMAETSKRRLYRLDEEMVKYVEEWSLSKTIAATRASPDARLSPRPCPPWSRLQCVRCRSKLRRTIASARWRRRRPVVTECSSIAQSPTSMSLRTTRICRRPV